MEMLLTHEVGPEAVLKHLNYMYLFMPWCMQVLPRPNRHLFPFVANSGPQTRPGAESKQPATHAEMCSYCRGAQSAGGLVKINPV